MKKNLNFFILIIGTEILNRRRADAHFDFVTKALAHKGHVLTGSFIIEDDPELIIETIKLIASKPNAILLSFGGIGSTPDDHTRKCAAIALRHGELLIHEEAKRVIEKELGEAAYPHSIKMAELPKEANLLENPVNKMPAFSLDERYFFMPGFPEMSHPMTKKILHLLIPIKKEIFRHTLIAQCKENLFIGLMEQMSKNVEFSSLPKLRDNGKHKQWEVTISIASSNPTLASTSFAQYTQLLDEENIPYNIDK